MLQKAISVIFQSTFPRGERQTYHSAVGKPCAFQSTFPRGERLSEGVSMILSDLFQSTFPRGERRNSSADWSKCKNFNPRSRVGNDGYLALAFQANYISIHVPAWGTTLHICMTSLHLQFQSTFPRGERPCTHLKSTPLGIFQSTFPRGERLQISTIFHLYICISSTNSHFSITSFCIFYLIHFFLICFFQLFMVRIFWGFSVYFWFALYRNNT